MTFGDGGGGIGLSMMLMMGSIFGGIIINVVIANSFARHNQAIDNQIKDYLQTVNQNEGAGGAQFALVTMWTQACKPKGARTYRAIVAAPAGLPMMGGAMGLMGAAMSMMGGGGCGSACGGGIMMGTPAPMTAVPAVGMPVSAPPTAPTMNSVNITVPDNMRAGDTMQVAAPDGSGVYAVQVPPGIGPGQMFVAQIPAGGVPVVNAVAVPVA